MKAFGKFLAVLLAVGGVATFAGCSKSTGSKSAVCANWNVRTRTAVEGNSASYWQTHKEVATYAITYTGGTNSTYSVSYDTESALFTTEFYIDSANYDWSSSSLPEDYRKEGEKSVVYVYKTSLTISGEYKLTASGETYAFSDKLITECKFRLAKDGLAPVYSYQEVKNTAPATLDAVSILGTYVVTEATYKTYYNYESTQAEVSATTANGTTTNRVNLSDDGYSVVDNCQIRAAIRALDFNEGSASFTVCIPQTATKQVCSVTLASATELDPENEEQKGIAEALNNSSGYVFFNGTAASEEETEKHIRYNAATLAVAGSSMNGSPSTYWYSTVENIEANTTRRVMLKASTPISFGMGTLDYTLKSLSVEAIS